MLKADYGFRRNGSAAGLAIDGIQVVNFSLDGSVPLKGGTYWSRETSFRKVFLSRLIHEQTH